ncbi:MULTISPECIES: glucose 1-dehydrogenase [Paenibacillus]|uniref:3-alpha-hydroxysteroid dehydrogenase n=1 Tax=Paenibacillus glycanilyticus TaxID=126569 RepID=A0ABQ6NUM1_9BACL|nr:MULTISPECIES: glucose 1-dehydrogenase [Paenibacillus]MCK9860467.1 glucose 1-dehydrogenase [Paenibacillus sp. ATY16]GMK47932.1 3-alpha-hydroxysteroid dehydrogenase [Paenibacillus glycanilyticus]
MRLEGKVAIITGAGTGIGKSTALRFAKEGAKVVVTDINEASVKQTADEVKKLGGEALAIRHDVGSEDNWIQVVDEAVKAFGTIDVLFNNAGIYVIKPLFDTTVEDWNRLMNINVTSVFLGMKHVIPVMLKQQRGSVINASSIAGIGGSPNHVLYGASKGAVRTMTKDVAMEFATQGIRVNSIHPGYINTAMVDYAAATTHRDKEALGQAVSPIGRVGNVDEVSNLVLFLASDESSYMTGTEMVIDGGAMAR